MTSAIRYCLIITFCAFIAVTSGFSQSMIAIDIPFNFEAAGMSMPAGHYSVRHFPNPNWILLVSGDQRSVATVPIQESQAPSAEENPKLVFHRYGDRYFLTQVWTTHDRQLHLCYKSSSERALAKAYQSPVEVAIMATSEANRTR